MRALAEFDPDQKLALANAFDLALFPAREPEKLPLVPECRSYVRPIHHARQG